MGAYIGAFVVASKEPTLPGVVGPIFRGYLEQQGQSFKGHSLNYVTRRDWNFVGVLPSHDDDSNWDTFQWAIDHVHVAAQLAKKLGTTVWAYYVEPRSDYIEATKFTKSGKGRSYEGVREMARALKTDADSLINDLPFLGSVTYPTAGPDDSGAFEQYVENLPPAPSGPIVEKDANVAVFLRNEVTNELRQIAERFGADVGTVLWAGWEAGKADLHKATPDYEDNYLEAPPPNQVAAVKISLDNRGLPDLNLSSTKNEVKVHIPEGPAQEVVALARHADRTMSWVLEQAYLRGRQYIGWRPGPLLNRRHRSSTNGCVADIGTLVPTNLSHLWSQRFFVAFRLQVPDSPADSFSSPDLLRFLVIVTFWMRSLS